MSISGISPITGSPYTQVYALSPYLNGVRRTSDAARAIEDISAGAIADAAKTASATAAAAQAASLRTPTTAEAAAQVALQAEVSARADATQAISTIATTNAVTVAPRATAPAVPTAPIAAPAAANPATNPLSTLTGDAGLLVQSYGAALSAVGPLALSPVYATPIRPAVSPVAAIASTDRPKPIDVAA